LTGADCGLVFKAGFVGGHMLVDFFGCILAGITLFFLKHANKRIQFSGAAVKVVTGEFSPPGLAFATDIFTSP
jgi:hypothetical protein